MNVINTLYFSLRAVAETSGSQGRDDTTRKNTRRFYKAYHQGEVPHSASLPVAGAELNQYFGSTFPFTQETSDEIVRRAIELAQEEGWEDVVFEITLTLETALGTMAATMDDQNEDEA